MPILRIEMHPGRTVEQKKSFVREATRVVVETLVCPPESVEIIITEVPKDAWATSGKRPLPCRRKSWRFSRLVPSMISKALRFT